MKFYFIKESKWVSGKREIGTGRFQSGKFFFTAYVWNFTGKIDLSQTSTSRSSKFLL